MTLQISVNQPNRPEGDEIYINGLGLFKNGEQRELTEEVVGNWDIHNPDVDLRTANFPAGVEVFDPDQKQADEALLHQLEAKADAGKSSTETELSKKTTPKKTEEVK